MPGTFGTLLGIPLAFVLSRSGPIVFMIGTVLFLLFAVAVAELHEMFTKNHDPGEVVIDEVVGFVVAMTFLPLTWQSFLGAFLLFRFFDILKPFPIRQIDNRIQGGLGTVLDDVAAGIVSNFILQIVFMNTPWLGVGYAS